MKNNTIFLYSRYLRETLFKVINFRESLYTVCGDGIFYVTTEQVMYRGAIKRPSAVMQRILFSNCCRLIRIDRTFLESREPF